MVLLLAALVSATYPVNPGESIQYALDACISGDTVLLLPGTHQWEGEHAGILTGEHRGVLLLGDIQHPDEVILHGGELSGSILVIDGSEGQVDSTTAVAGITFLQGSAGDPPFGGGIYMERASPRIQGCRFVECSADNGGAMFAWRGAPVIESCVFESNQCVSGGGAVYLYASEAEVRSCRFHDSWSGDDGGALYCFHCSPIIVNCLFEGGYAHDDGGGIYCYALSSPEIAFCTFTGNDVLYTGSAVYFRVSSSPDLHDNIVTGNSGPAFFIQDGGDPSFSYNCVWGNPDGNYGNLPDPTGTDGNISMDPLLVGDWFLAQEEAGETSTSPCVDTGSCDPGEYLPENSWTRTDGVADSGIADMGYHHVDSQWEHWAPPLLPPITDMVIYPNPSSGQFTVLPPDSFVASRLELFDITGRQVWEIDLTTGRNEISIVLPIPAGLYVLRVCGSGRVSAATLVIVGVAD